jgi:hypothetical protein
MNKEFIKQLEKGGLHGLRVRKALPKPGKFEKFMFPIIKKVKTNKKYVNY